MYTTCGSDDKVKFLKDLVNQDDRLHVINYKTQSGSKTLDLSLMPDFEDEVKKIDDGVDHIIDFIGKDYFNQNISLLRRDGTLVFLAVMSGAAFPPGAVIAPILFKRLTLKGSTLRSRDVAYQRGLLEKFQELALPKIVKGEMKVMVHDVLDWEKIQEAHTMMTENKNSGKVGRCRDPC